MMLRVLILLHDANDEGRTKVLTELQIVNDGTGDADYGNYEVLQFNEGSVVPVRDQITDYQRRNGAIELVRRALA